jgi:hypothetical protein
MDPIPPTSEGSGRGWSAGGVGEVEEGIVGKNFG